jgi:hypothetical protein
MKKLILVTLLLSSTYLVAGPAPKGDAKVVADIEIRKAEHPCGQVTSAIRKSDGAIYAVCSNTEDYLISNQKTNQGIQTLVIRCSVLPKIGMPRSTCKNTK